jgi:hypothetical protein
MRHALTVAFFLAASCVANAQSIGPHSALAREHPDLQKLFNEYRIYAPAFEKYAHRQGFRKPVEQLATVVHEMVHVASARHQGFFIHGTFYEPYVAASAWPRLSNRDVMPQMLLPEKGLMHSVYMAATPDNRLGNIIDELNAYAHVMPFVCRHERESAEKQVRNVVGLLHIVEAYLRVARIVSPGEYAALLANRASAGAIATITQNAWSALAGCGLPRAMVPRSETEAFLARLG